MTERPNKPRLLLFVLCCFYFSFGFAQNDSSLIRPKNNLVSLDLTTNLIWRTYGLAYERQLNQGFVNSFVRGKYQYGQCSWKTELCYGSFHKWSAMFGVYTGRKNHHFEMALGAGTTNQVVTYRKEERYLGILMADLGYRYAKPGGRINTMLGLSWPNGLYLRMGMKF